MRQENKEKVEQYLKQPYTRMLMSEPEGGYSSYILEFSGCQTCGETPDEALANLEVAAFNWIEASLKQGHQIPPPNRTAQTHTSLKEFLIVEHYEQELEATRNVCKHEVDRRLRELRKELGLNTGQSIVETALDWKRAYEQLKLIKSQTVPYSDECKAAIREVEKRFAAEGVSLVGVEDYGREINRRMKAEERVKELEDANEDIHENQYLAGHRAAYGFMLMECARNLGAKDPLAHAAYAIAERESGLRAIQSLARNLDLSVEWHDDVNLGDIIDKQFGKALIGKLEKVDGRRSKE